MRRWVSARRSESGGGPDSLRRETLELLRIALADSRVDFRDGQWEAIDALVRRRERLLVVQRTGWGKSVVYFLATALLRRRGTGPTLLISPLLALMRNQIAAAERLGIRAATINSSNTREWDTVRRALDLDQVDILLISPERLADDDFRDRVLLAAVDHVGLFVVDEAHCISDWGHDFRPDYRRISRVIRLMPPTVPVLATTATASHRVVEDISAVLGESIRVVRGPLARTSLRLQNITLPGQAERLAWLAEYVPSLAGNGIIYTLTVRDAQQVALWLQAQGIDAGAYWGGLGGDERELLEERLLRNQIKALVATTALGMGYDKPDLGFVIHYQRPASVVHYYQQVGRAGRATDCAYGILLGGDEDLDISNYFIRTAFPPESHIDSVLCALRQADDGYTIPSLEQHVNLSRGQIEKVLKTLAVQSPAPVVKGGSRWYATPVAYVTDRAAIERLTRLRHQEQEQMSKYLQSRDCLMVFLTHALDDPHCEPCGCCAACNGRPLLPERSSDLMVSRAREFLRHNDQVIEPRRQWPVGARPFRGGSATIPAGLRVEPIRTLCIWGDDGWGDLVRRGKQGGRFDDALVESAAVLIQTRWHPTPRPTWVTCVPSLAHPTLVPDFAARLARRLGLPFVPCVRKTRRTEPQKRMENSFSQLANIEGAFSVSAWPSIHEPALLVDDMVDSRWTFTMVGALLRDAGCGNVFPFALAVTSKVGED